MHHPAICVRFRLRRSAAAAAAAAGILGVLVIAGATPGVTAAPQAAPPPAADAPAGLPAERLAAHVASFDAVWETVKQTHWDPEKVGEAWDAARDELRPKILGAETDGEARQVIQRLLDSLGQSHFGIIPKDAYARVGEESASAAAPASDDADADDADDADADTAPGGWHGLTFRLIDGQLVVTRVDPGSPGAAAGVRPGWALESAGGRPASRLVEVARDLVGLQRLESIAASLALSRLSGDVGSTIDATFLDAGDEPVEVTLTLAASTVPVASLGNLPPMPVEIESRTLASGVGYFRLGAFFGPDRVMPAWRSFIQDHADAPGIVLDLRGNPGGVILMSTGLLNFLVAERGNRLGTMHMRDPARGPFEMPIMINPRGTTYAGPLAVLVDEMSMSNSEILAAAVQDLERGHVVGARTAGLVLPSTAERLPNGDGFLRAFAGYDRPNGTSLEGAGVSPDVPAPLTRAALLSGVDPALVIAVGLIVERVPVAAAGAEHDH